MKQKPDEDHFLKRCQWFESCCEQRHTSALISGLWSRLAVIPADGMSPRVQTSWMCSTESCLWGWKHNFPSNNSKFPFDTFWVVNTAINSRHVYIYIFFFNSYRSSGSNIKLTSGSRPSPSWTASSSRIMRLRPVWQLRYSVWSPWRRTGRGLR